MREENDALRIVPLGILIRVLRATVILRGHPLRRSTTAGNNHDLVADIDTFIRVDFFMGNDPTVTHVD